MKRNLAACDGGTGIMAAATRELGREPTVRVAGAAGGFGGHADFGAGEVVIAPNPDCCGATQTMIHELTNISNHSRFQQITNDAAAGNLSREDYTRAMERIEYDGVRNALRAFDACKDTWGCGAGATARHEWIRGAADFDDYYNNYLAESHKNYWRNAWDTNYRSAYEARHP